MGLGVTSVEDNGTLPPISRVTLMVDDNNAITAGDDTGREIVADCPFATQEMVNALLANLQGYQYHAYTASDAGIDPAVELGDAVTVDNIYSVVTRIEDDGTGYPSISAPGEAELEDEYPSVGPVTQTFNRQISETRSLISKTSEEILLQVENELKGLSSSFSVQLGQIQSQVTGLDGQMSSITQTVSSITSRVDGLEGDFTEVSVTLDGLTVTDETGETVINGSKIQTKNLFVSAANISGTLTANQINLTGAITWGDLAIDSKNQITSAQDTASSAYQIASNANNTANAIGNTVSAWTYQGSTYIDGSKIMTGTVMASKLLGGTVGLLASDQTVVGSLDIAYTTTGIGLGITSRYGGMQLRATGGNIYIESGYGPFLQLGIGASGNTPICQLGGGPLVLSSDSFGSSLPGTGVYGQVFFLLG